MIQKYLWAPTQRSAEEHEADAHSTEAPSEARYGKPRSESGKYYGRRQCWGDGPGKNERTDDEVGRQSHDRDCTPRLATPIPVEPVSDNHRGEGKDSVRGEGKKRTCSLGVERPGLDYGTDGCKGRCRSRRAEDAEHGGQHKDRRHYGNEKHGGERPAILTCHSIREGPKRS